MKKKIRIVFNAPVILLFAAVCLAALGLDRLSSGLTGRVIFSTYRSSPLTPLTYVRLFAHIFGHSGTEHLVGNLTYILLLGPMLEEKYGSRLLLEVMALTALVTALINCAFFPHTALCGASGVVFAFILLSSFTGFREGEIPLTFLLVAVLFIGRQVIQGAFVKDQISNMAHITGGIIGGLTGWGLNRQTRFSGFK